MAAVLFAMSPILTQSAASAEDNINRPPLPLTGNTGQQFRGSDVRVNPFCLPVAIAEPAPILLASGSESSGIRLQPIGAAIGLHDIGKGPVDHSSTPAITIEQPIASDVQTNPLIAPTMELPTVSTQNVETVRVAESKPIVQQHSSIVLLPTKPTENESDQPVALSDPTGALVIAEPAMAEPVMAQSEMTVPETTVEIAEPLLPAGTEPVYFSFSDDSESDLGSDHESDMEAETREPSSIEDNLVLETEPEALSVDPIALSVMPTADTIDAKPIESKLMESVSRPQRNQFVVETEPVVNHEVAKPEPSLHSRRYRPPVAVHPVPLNFETSRISETDSQVDSVVVSAPRMDNQATERDEPVVTSLYMNRTQVRSLTLGAELQSVKIADKNVCQAFAAGPNQIKLIGTGNGSTRLVVYAKPSDGDSQPRIRSFQIHVKDAVEVTGDPTGDRSTILNQTIQQAFPDADVVVRRNGNELIVMGRCGSEAVAKKIVRMVRRSCLVPVKDQLRVR
jgi:hypothetical protein